MSKITVTAKFDAGTHPKYGLIVKGESYEIDEADFGDELFERPAGWLPPWERQPAPETAPAPAGQKKEKAR